MASHTPDEFVLRIPTLAPGVAVCDGIPRACWNTKGVTITNEAGDDVAKRVCRSVDAELVIDMDGRCLGDDRAAIQIAQSLCEEEVPSTWMWSMHSWVIKQVSFNGASLYDHDQTATYNATVSASRRRVRVGVRAYDSSRERREPNNPPKKKALLTMQAIAQVAAQDFCSRNCLQTFPRGQIQALRFQIHGEGGVYFRNHRLLDVHRQIHRDANGKEMITLEGVEVCPIVWMAIHGISRATFYRFKGMARAGKRAKPHGNLGSKKPRTHTVQATATLRLLIDTEADPMPHKSRTVESGEKVPAMVLPSRFCWIDKLPEINEANARFNLQPISSSGLSNIRRASFPEFAPKSCGDSFARCGQCDQYKQLRSACTSRSTVQDKWSKLLSTHIAGQRTHRELYYTNRDMSVKSPEKVFTIIHDKMDHSKTASPHYSHKSKATDSFMKLPVAVTGMIAHGHGDIRYAHYGLDIFPTDSNHTIGSIANLLRDLENVPKYSSRELFAGMRQSSLSKALLGGTKICLESFLFSAEEVVTAQPLPPTLTLQLDNASGDNKNRWVFPFCSMFVHRAIFREVYINFLIVGDTHEDIDALFGRWSSKLKTNDYPTLPRLMKSFMDCETHPAISHLIEEVSNFKRFVQGYLGTGGDYLEGHSSGQQFKFHVDSKRWPIMEYKILCTDVKWLSEHGEGIRLWSETADGRPKVPDGSLAPLSPQQMHSFDEVCKDLDGFIAHWSKMADDDFSGEFRRKNESIKYYWKDVRTALNDPLVVHEALEDGFWPSSMIEAEVEDQMQYDGTLREEFAEDAPFVGRRRDRPPPSFRVGRDVFAGYFIVVRPADRDPKPFWLARALTNPNPDPGHLNMIRIQYWTPTSDCHINMNTYDGWDRNEGIVWRKDTPIRPCWSNTGCIMTAFKARGKKRVDGEPYVTKVKISKAQINIIKLSVATLASNSNNDVSSAGAEE